MSIRADFTARRGDFVLDVDVTVDDGETVAVLGPNGSGKSSLVQCLAGLVPIESGSISIGGQVVDRPESGVHVPTEERRLGVVFQDYLLFEHLSVADNVGFGLVARGLDTASVSARVGSVLAALEIDDLASSKPNRISGGQAQRVALARALAIDPVALLMDEPMSALDVATRRRVRQWLRNRLVGFAGPRLIVTHDPLDAYALADRVIVLEEGRVTHHGTIADLTARPKSAYVAELVGTNLLRGLVHGTSLELESGTVVHLADRHEGRVFAIVRPRSITLSRRLDPQSSARNSWQLRVDGVEINADRVRVSLTGAVDLTAEITLESLSTLGLRTGEEVVATVKATDIEVFPS